MAGDLAENDESLAASLGAMRAEIAEMRVAQSESEIHAAEFPHRERYLRLVHSLGRKLLDVHEAWLDEVEEELGPGSHGRRVVAAD